MSGGEACVRLGLRRPMGYFGAFNKWWSDFFLQNGRRPNKTDIETWRVENPTWRPELTLEEIVQHSKGRRDPEKNRQYFIEYRRKMRGSSKRPARRRGVGRRPASKAQETDDPSEEATSDDGGSEGEGDDDNTPSASPKPQQPHKCRAHGPSAADATKLHPPNDGGDGVNWSQDPAEEPEPVGAAAGSEQGVAHQGSDTGPTCSTLRCEPEGAAGGVLGGPSSAAAQTPLEPLHAPQVLTGATSGVVASFKILVRRSRGPTSALARQLRLSRHPSAEIAPSRDPRAQLAENAGGLQMLSDGADGPLGSLLPAAAATATAGGPIVADPAAAAACPAGDGDAVHPAASLPAVESTVAAPPGTVHVHPCTRMLHPVVGLPVGPGLLTELGPELGPEGTVPMPWWPACPGEPQCWASTALPGALFACLTDARRPSATSGPSGAVLAGLSDACASTLPFCDNDLQRTGSSGSISTCGGPVAGGRVAGGVPIGKLPYGSNAWASPGLGLGTPHTATGTNSSSDGSSSASLGALASPTGSAAGAPKESAPPPAKRQRFDNDSQAAPKSHVACLQQGGGRPPPDLQLCMSAHSCRSTVPLVCRPADLTADGAVASNCGMPGAPGGLLCGHSAGLGLPPAGVPPWTEPVITVPGPGSWSAGGLGGPVAPLGCIQGHGARGADPQPLSDPAKRYGSCGLQLDWSDADRVWVDSLFADGQAELGAGDTQPTGPRSTTVEEPPEVDFITKDFGDGAAWADLLAQDWWGSLLTETFASVGCT